MNTEKKAVAVTAGTGATIGTTAAVFDGQSATGITNTLGAVIEFEKFSLPENYDKVVTAACWGHCCVHGGYGNDEW